MNGIKTANANSSVCEGTIITPTRGLYIGRNYQAQQDGAWDGQIDNVQIFDRALTATEIQNLYNGSVNNTNYYGKYANEGNFSSMVFYNESSTYWNVSMDVADSDYKDTLDYVNTSQLMSYWRFDGDLNDSVGNNDGVNNGTNDTVGIVGHAKYFNSYDTFDYVSFGAGSLSVSEGTISLWINSEGDGSCTSFFCYIFKHYSSGNRIYISRDRSTNTLETAFNTGDASVTSHTIGTNEWHHIVLRWNGGDVTVYANGEQVDNYSRDALTSVGGFTLGTSSDTNEEYHGIIDEVLIFNSSLSAEEIYEIFEEQGKYYGIGFNTSIGINSSDLISYWPLDESFDDLVGGNDGTPSGGVMNATGISSGAMSFDGVDDYVSIGDYGSQNQNQLTYSMWFKTPSIGSGHPVIFRTESSSSAYYRYQARIDDSPSGEVYSCFRAGATTNNFCIQTTGTSYLDDEWHHLVATYDDVSDEHYLYMDGIEIGEDNTDIGVIENNPPNKDTYIGAHGGASHAFDGQIDEVLIYNRSLEASEVQDLYKAGLSQHANTNITMQTRTADSYNVSDAGLVGLWGLNGNPYDELGVNNGTDNGNNYSDSYGVVGQGGYFDGGNDIIEISNSDSLDTTANGEMTVSAWIKSDITDYSSNGYIVSMYDYGSNSRMWALVAAASNDEWRWVTSTDGATANAINSGVSITTDWTHLAVSHYDNTTPTKIYVNGKEVYSNNIDGIGDHDSFLTVGALINGVSVTNEFEGTIDEVRIYNRSLNETEVQNLYELGSYHIEWNDWETVGKINDAEPQRTNSSSKFVQMKNVFNTDDTDVSAYMLNHNITSVSYVPPSVITTVNTSYYGININISDFTFSSSDYVVLSNTTFNTSSLLTGFGALSSFNVVKTIGSGDSDVYGKVSVDGVTIIEQKLRTAGKTGGTLQPGVTGFKPFNFAVANGEHYITLEVYRTSSGTIQIDDIDFSLGKFESTAGFAGRGNLTTFNTDFSSLTPTLVYTKNITKNVITSTYIAGTFSINASAQTDVICNFQNGGDSPYFIVSIPDDQTTRTASTNYITEPESISDSFNITCYSTNVATVGISGTFIEADMADDNNNTIHHISISNSSTNYTNTLIFNEGYNKLIEDKNHLQVNGTNRLMSVSFSTRSLTGEQTPTYMINITDSDNGTVMFMSKKERYHGTSGVGNIFFYPVAEGLVPGHNYTSEAWINVPAGEQIEVLDESFSLFENTIFDTAIINIAPLVTINSPTSGTFITNGFNINWTTQDTQLDRYLSNVTITNQTHTIVIQENINDTTSSIYYDSNLYGWFNLTVESCENETVDLFCGDDTIDVFLSPIAYERFVFDFKNTHNNNQSYPEYCFKFSPTACWCVNMDQQTTAFTSC